MEEGQGSSRRRRPADNQDTCDIWRSVTTIGRPQSSSQSIEISIKRTCKENGPVKEDTAVWHFGLSSTTGVGKEGYIAEASSNCN